MELRIRSVALDFVVGGIIVAGALFVASLFGPVYGGILAGAPIRAGSTIFLEGLQHGTKSATELTRGVVLAMLANVGFSKCFTSPCRSSACTNPSSPPALSSSPCLS
jgi:hypothetical protein